MKIGFNKVDKFVADQQDAGNDVRWNGWAMIFFKKHIGGFKGGGVYRNGYYGFETIIEADERGFWNLPPRLIV